MPLIPGKCNLCGFPIIRVTPGVFGTRCVSCRSTFLHRAMGMIIEKDMPDQNSYVYELSDSGALFVYLKKHFRYFFYSTYKENTPSGLIIRGIRNEDVEDISFKNDYFDLVTSTEVFEHVEDDVQGFREIFRILKPGGLFLFTVPLSGPKTILRAERVNEILHHHLPPEYHSDRIRGRRKVFTYRNYGFDLKDLLEKQGFRVEILSVQDETHAISPCHVIRCAKPQMIN